MPKRRRLKKRQKKNNVIGPLIVLIALCYIATPYLQSNQSPIQNEQVIHSDVVPTPVPTNNSLEGTRLIVISESKDRPTSEVILLDDATFWETYLQDMGMDFLIIDPDDPSHKEEVKVFNTRASERNIQGSYIAHVDRTTLINMIPMPKTTDKIKQMLERGL